MKFIKPVICMLFMIALGYRGYGQYHMHPVNHNIPVNRVYRQNQGRRLEMVKEGFISRQLKLTSDESKAFWPVYHRYVQDQTAVRILKRENNSNTSPNGTEQIDKELDYEQQLVDIRKRYREEFEKVLPPEKVSELYKSERQFNDEVLRQLSERTMKQ